MINDHDEIYAGHPALRGFDRTWETIKHIALTAIKNAARWAAIGGITLSVLAIPAAGAVSFVNTVTFGLSEFILGSGTSFFASALVNGLGVGSILGITSGAIGGIADADEAVKAKALERIADYEQLEHRQQRQIALAQQRDQRNGAMLVPAGLPGWNTVNSPCRSISAR